MGTDKVIIYARFDDSTKDFPITQFAQIGIVKNPTKVGSAATYTDSTFSSLQSVKLDTVTGSNEPIIGEIINQKLSLSAGEEFAKGYVVSYDKETKVLKYFRDRSLYLNPTTFDHTDRVGVTTSGRIYQFESATTSKRYQW